MNSIELRIGANPAEVSLIGRSVRALCEPLLGEDAATSVELAICEAVNNVVEHAYRDFSDGLVTVRWTGHPDRVCIEVRDRGAPLPRGALDRGLPEFDPDNLESLPEGGFGLGIVSALAHEVRYMRDAGGCNTLSLTWFREPAAAMAEPRETGG